MTRMLACLRMRRLALPAFCLAFAAAASAADKPQSGGAFDFKLEPGKVHEHCEKLARGETRRYHWKANVAVDFNIHYHEGDKVTFPVKRDAMRGDGGSFTADVAQDFCWMWTARNSAAQVSGEVRK